MPPRRHIKLLTGSMGPQREAEGDFHFLNNTFLSCVHFKTSKCHVYNNKNNKGFKHLINSEPENFDIYKIIYILSSVVTLRLTKFINSRFYLFLTHNMRLGILSCLLLRKVWVAKSNSKHELLENTLKFQEAIMYIVLSFLLALYFCSLFLRTYCRKDVLWFLQVSRNLWAERN